MNDLTQQQVGPARAQLPMQTAIVALTPTALSPPLDLQPRNQNFDQAVSRNRCEFDLPAVSNTASATPTANPHNHLTVRSGDKEARTPVATSFNERPHKASDPVIIPHGAIQYSRNSCCDGVGSTSQHSHQANIMKLLAEKKTPQHQQYGDHQAIISQNHNNNRNQQQLERSPGDYLESGISGQPQQLSPHVPRIGAAQASRRHTSDRQKRYKLSPTEPTPVRPPHQSIHSSLLQTSNNFSDGNAQVSRAQLYVSPKQTSPAQGHQANHHQQRPQQQRLLPERAQGAEQQRLAVNNFRESMKTMGQQPQSPSQQQQPSTTIMGLGLGMGIQMGTDGRFYASMGGVTMHGSGSAADNQNTDQQVVTGIMSQPTSPKHGLVSPSKGKEGLQARQRLSDVSSSCQQVLRQGEAEQIVQASTPSRQHKGKLYVQNGRGIAHQVSPQAQAVAVPRRESKLRGNLDDYQEILNTVQAQVKITQRARNQPFSASKDGAYHLKSPSRGGKPQTSNSFDVNSGNDGSAVGAQKSVGAPQRTRDAIGAAQAKQACSEQLNHKSHEKPFQVTGSNRGGPPRPQKLTGANGSSDYNPTNLTTKAASHVVKASHKPRMNSTNESSFTQQPSYSHNLITSNLDAAASSFSMGVNGAQPASLPQSSHRHGNNTGQVSQPGLYSPERQNSKDSRPFIIMKNKVEENSKLLKYDVAQQIIAANPGKSHVINSAKARTHDGKQIQGNSPIIRQQSEVPIVPDNAGGFSPQHSERQDALNIFYKQITNENAQLDHGPGQHPSIAIQGATSQLNKNKNQLAPGSGSPMLQKYNSMEMPLNQLNQNKEQSQPVQQIAIQPLNMAKIQEQNKQQLIIGTGRKDTKQHLSYRFMSEKRASLPQPLGSEASETDRPDHREFLKQHIEHVKRNSLQAVPQFTQPINIIIPPQTAGEYDPFESRQGGMFAKEGAATLTSPIKSPKLSDAHLSPENADWIKRALDASKSKQLAGEGMAGSESPRQLLALGSSSMHLPLSGRSSPVAVQSSRLGENSDSNSKRARIVLDKKKKQFEMQKEQQRWRQAHQYTTQQQVTVQQMLAHDRLQSDLLQKSGVQEAVMAAMSPSRQPQQQPVAGTQIGVPNISIKSILPAQAAANVQQSPKMRNLGEHPLSSQQLLNGFSKNVAAANNQNQRPNRRAHQEKAFQQNQGIQGKNITIIHQSKAVAQQASLMRQLGEAQKMATNNTGGNTTDGSEAALIKALESQLDPKDFKALQILQAQLHKDGYNLNNLGSRKHLLQAMHAAETGQFQPQMITGVSTPLQALASAKQENGSLVDKTLFQFGIPKQGTGKLVVFNYNGQTYVRNSETAKIYHAGKAYLQTNGGTEGSDQGETDDSNPPSHRSNAASQADQMVQSSMGLRSLSKMLQGAHFEAALQQLVAKQAQAEQNQNFLQQVTLVSTAITQQPSHPSSTMKVRGRGEKVPKSKLTSPQRGAGMRPGESNGSLSTKPATSTTNSTYQRKGTEGEESKQNSLTKKGKSGKKEPTKQRVHIFHECDDTLKNHKINKAINTINNIIRLIFKNNKDSSALTTTSNSNSLNGPPGNRLMEEYRIVELQKIAKQINISIPKKFDSKSSLREFFYSREFILNVKIKMNNLLHKAILSANNVPASVIEANMCGNQALAYGAAGREGESKIYQAKKFWVGHGNNFPIVKSVLKQRYWWQYGSEESFGADCDFIWTSWKKQKHIDFLTNSNEKHKQKMEKKQEPAFQEENEVSEAAATAAASQIQNETEQKITTNQESKLSKRKLRGPAGAAASTAVEPKEPVKEEALVAATPQETAKIDRIAFPLRLYNKLEQNKQLTNKKGVFVNMRRYYESLGQDPFKVLPLTFHTQQGVNDPEFRKFQNYYNQVEQRHRASERQAKEAIKKFHADKREAANKKKAQDDDYASEVDTDDEEAIEKIQKKYRAPQNAWIIKPGENTNRGQGITVVKTIKEVQSIIGRPSKKDDRTFIIQKYIDYPLLVHKRKFDFRCFGLLTSINGSLKGYCYQDGYIRTSCREYTLDDVSDPFIHLTNDAIQQKSDDYGKFENGNKLSLQDFTKVVCAQQPELDFDFHRDIFPQIQKLIADTFKAAFTKIDPQRLQNTFELFGYDFMLDEDFRLYLIEVNTNPCLEVCCPLLARIIPEVLDNSFKIVLDPIFPSPDLSHNRKFQLNELPQEVKFQLVFDEDVEGEQIRANLTRGTKGSIREAVGEEDIESDKENELAEDDGEDY